MVVRDTFFWLFVISLAGYIVLASIIVRAIWPYRQAIRMMAYQKKRAARRKKGAK